MRTAATAARARSGASARTAAIAARARSVARARIVATAARARSAASARIVATAARARSAASVRIVATAARARIAASVRIVAIVPRARSVVPVGIVLLARRRRLRPGVVRTALRAAAAIETAGVAAVVRIVAAACPCPSSTRPSRTSSKLLPPRVARKSAISRTRVTCSIGRIAARRAVVTAAVAAAADRSSWSPVAGMKLATGPLRLALPAGAL